MTIRANVLRWEDVEKLEVVAKRTSPRQKLTDPHARSSGLISQIRNFAIVNVH